MRYLVYWFYSGNDWELTFLNDYRTLEIVMGLVEEYPTMHYPGIPRQTQPMITYDFECFRDFRVSQSQVAQLEHCGNVINMSYLSQRR